MGQQTVQAFPELFLEHNGIRIFNTYKYFDAEEPLRFSYTTQGEKVDDGDSDFAFDARKLPTYVSPERSTIYSDLEACEKAIRLAIESSLITAPGKGKR